MYEAQGQQGQRAMVGPSGSLMETGRAREASAPRFDIVAGSIEQNTNELRRAVVRLSEVCRRLHGSDPSSMIEKSAQDSRVEPARPSVPDLLAGMVQQQQHPIGMIHEIVGYLETL